MAKLHSASPCEITSPFPRVIISKLHSKARNHLYKFVMASPRVVLFLVTSQFHAKEDRRAVQRSSRRLRFLGRRQTRQGAMLLLISIALLVLNFCAQDSMDEREVRMLLCSL